MGVLAILSERDSASAMTFVDSLDDFQARATGRTALLAESLARESEGPEREALRHQRQYRQKNGCGHRYEPDGQ